VASYAEWAWSLDPNGAGWHQIPLPVVNVAEETAARNALPDNWPSSVTYTPFLLWETTQVALLRLRSTANRPLATVRIQKLPSSHPAAMACPEDAEAARGLFARCNIPTDTWIGDYTGVVKPQVANDGSRYLLEVFHDPLVGLRLDVDSQLYGNETRFINDDRGLGLAANVSFCPYRRPTTGELAVGVVSTGAIKAGEELLANYGTNFWGEEKSPEKNVKGVVKGACPHGRGRRADSPCAKNPVLGQPATAAKHVAAELAALEQGPGTREQGQRPGTREVRVEHGAPPGLVVAGKAHALGQDRSSRSRSGTPSPTAMPIALSKGARHVETHPTYL